MNLHLSGIHHVSALTNNIQRNHKFYTQVLGLRLVKKTVNQDDSSMYHLFYADALGSPGTDITFFDMPKAAAEHKGNNSITRCTFKVSQESFAYWQERFTEHALQHDGVVDRNNRFHLDFEDPDGLSLSLVADGEAGHSWENSPVPAQYQIRGLGYVEITIPDLRATHQFLTALLNLQPVGTYPCPSAPGHLVHVYRMQATGPASELHVAVRPDLTRARYGSGGVHHLALRIPDLQYQAWAERLAASGLPFSGEVDRYYFKSLYIREPNGILFELATEGPGFGIDERDMGQQLSLPPFLEPQRAQIEAKLSPIE